MKSFSESQTVIYLFKSGGIVALCVHGNEGTYHPVQPCASVMLLIVFGRQWSSVAQTKKIYQAFKHTLPVLFGDNRKNTEYLQTLRFLRSLHISFFFKLQLCRFIYFMKR